MAHPLEDPDLAHDVEVLREWAERTPEIQRVILFGSRVQGRARPSSDLDVNVVHEPAPSDAGGSASAAAERRDWLADLQPRMRLRLDLWSHLAPSDAEKVHAGIKTGSLVIYDGVAT